MWTKTPQNTTNVAKNRHINNYERAKHNVRHEISEEIFKEKVSRNNILIFEKKSYFVENLSLLQNLKSIVQFYRTCTTHLNVPERKYITKKVRVT